MKAKDLSPLEQNQRKERFVLEQTLAKIKRDWAFRKLKTFRDLYLSVGYTPEYIQHTYFPSELERILTYEDIKAYCQDLQITVNTRHYLERCPPRNEWSDLDSEKNANLSPIATDSNNIGIVASAPQVELPEELKDYGFVSSPNERFSPYWAQKKAIAEGLDRIIEKHYTGLLILARTGAGKTFIAGAILRRLWDMKYHEGRTMTMYPYVYITKANAITQTKRVLKNFFNLETEEPEPQVLVTNYDQLRSKFGELFVREKTIIEDGIERIKWQWRPHIHPVVIIWDEPHSLKNLDSMQSQIGQSINDLKNPVIQIQTGATPFSRVVEAKCFCVSTHVPIKTALGTQPLTNQNWPTFAEDIASNYGRSDTSIHEYSPAAMSRLRDYMNDYIIDVKGMRWQFKEINSVEIIHFESDHDREFYNTYYENFLKQKAKLEKQQEDGLIKNASFCILSELLKFRQAAELVKAPYLARNMYKDVQNGKAAVIACNFRGTITKIVSILVNDYNVPREQISLIWGGVGSGPKKKTKKQKLAEKLKQAGELIDENMDEINELLEDLDLNEVETGFESEFLTDISPDLKLGVQSKKDRQREIDKFQQGKALYCLYTFRAGGVALSLHHTDEQTVEKVRHKQSGYAVEEDIPLIPTRPRSLRATPTWSIIELLQGFGRCPRINSLSNTVQVMVFYAGTVEERVARVVSMKLRCHGKLVRLPKEEQNWSNIVVGNFTDDEVERRHLRESVPVQDGSEETSSLGEQSTDEEDDGEESEE